MIIISALGPGRISICTIFYVYTDQKQPEQNFGFGEAAAPDTRKTVAKDAIMGLYESNVDTTFAPGKELRKD